ncbi:MAG: pyridoxamine 5'-phosphate oxidase family protein [Cyclobacteriaceae bacterium]|nr:pyridoxamine 5'-phosphate oxidase family protein [Cyclobacteriaceae bacterium]
MSSFPVTDKTKITRLPKRGEYDQETVYSILDEALFCTVAYSKDNQPFQIPTGFCRIGNKLYIHGSVGSYYMRQLQTEKLPVCISVTLIDGMVLARSAFHHSVNYRSVVLFSKPENVTDKTELYHALEVFTNKMCPGRWDDVRKPNEGEWKATMVLSFEITEASAKVRVGAPKDDEEDYDLNIWAGVQPIRLERKAVVPDPALKAGIPVPGYLSADA